MEQIQSERRATDLRLEKRNKIIVDRVVDNEDRRQVMVEVGDQLLQRIQNITSLKQKTD